MVASSCNQARCTCILVNTHKTLKSSVLGARFLRLKNRVEFGWKAWGFFHEMSPWTLTCAKIMMLFAFFYVISERWHEVVQSSECKVQTVGRFAKTMHLLNTDLTAIVIQKLFFRQFDNFVVRRRVARKFCRSVISPLTVRSWNLSSLSRHTESSGDRLLRPNRVQERAAKKSIVLITLHFLCFIHCFVCDTVYRMYLTSGWKCIRLRGTNLIKQVKAERFQLGWRELIFACFYCFIPRN